VANGASLDRKRYDSIIAIQQNCRRKDTLKIGWILIAVGAFLIFFLASGIFTILLFSILIVVGFVMRHFANKRVKQLKRKA
jgi:ABC-type multidrug transport system fused ATPase/permease subunit